MTEDVSNGFFYDIEADPLREFKEWLSSVISKAVDRKTGVGSDLQANSRELSMSSGCILLLVQQY